MQQRRVKEVLVNNELILNRYDPNWVAGEPSLEYLDKDDPNLGLKGIKIDYLVAAGTSVEVIIKLEGCGYETSDKIEWGIKDGKDPKTKEVITAADNDLTRPVCLPNLILEFTTIAIPVE